MVLGPANEHDLARFVDAIQQIRIQSGARPRTRSGMVYAGKAYDSSAIRSYPASRKIKFRIAKRIWKAKNKKKTGRRYARVRSSVERFFAWLKGGFRRISVIYERLDVTYIGFSQSCIISDLLEGFEMSSSYFFNFCKILLIMIKH